MSVRNGLIWGRFDACQEFWRSAATSGGADNWHVQTRDQAIMAENSNDNSYIQLTANIVSAYVSNNTVPSAEIPNLIGQIHSALLRVSGGQAPSPAEPLKPAVPV